MSTFRNPFTTLYVTERLDQTEFPALFSPVLVPHITPLFEAGNVVIEGTQGTGKSMLLALLQTKVRLAYAESVEHSYPIQDKAVCQFICAGINLATNQALRPAARWKKRDDGSEDELRLCFIDYANTWILRDLLESIELLISRGKYLWEPLGLGGTSSEFDAAIQSLVDSPLLPLFSVGAPNAKSAIANLTMRIDQYLRFFNGRPKELPADIRDTQTQSLGQPVADAVSILKHEGCLSQSTRILIMLDQFEQLLEMEASLPNRPYGLLRDTIDQVLHRRESTLNFRIGTRPYAWQQPEAEALRDYHRLNLDEMLARTEHGNRDLFPNLASDVFARRLRAYGYGSVSERDDPIKAVFADYPKPQERVKHIGPKTDWSNKLSIPKTVDSSIGARLREIASVNPLEAKLGVAWAMQNLGECSVDEFPLDVDELPWNRNEQKKWWKKERMWLAILQLAADNRQKIVFFGKKDILDLSGGNILVFASICQHIWERWIRFLVNPKNRGAAWEDNLPIERKLQNEGILAASNTWHRKISEETWIGDTLLAFLDEMGSWLREKLNNDDAMSYPGGNGISLSNRDLNKFPNVRQVLSEASGRGFLLQRKHTPKIRKKGESQKWYPHPVLAPYYELTLNHTKEPRYITAEVVENWLVAAGVEIEIPRASEGRQMTLPWDSDADR